MTGFAAGRRRTATSDRAPASRHCAPSGPARSTSWSPPMYRGPRHRYRERHPSSTYQCPEDEKTYVHRIGRTGRAGNTGVAVTFVDWDDLHRWTLISKALDLSIPGGRPTRPRSTSARSWTSPGGQGVVCPGAADPRRAGRQSPGGPRWRTGQSAGRGRSHGRGRDSGGRDSGGRAGRVVAASGRHRHDRTTGEGPEPAAAQPQPSTHPLAARAVPRTPGGRCGFRTWRSVGPDRARVDDVAMRTPPATTVSYAVSMVVVSLVGVSTVAPMPCSAQSASPASRRCPDLGTGQHLVPR